jgi:replicative DNA helicase
MIQACTEVIRDGYSNTMTAQEFVESAERRVFAIAGDQATGETLDGAALCAEFMAAQARREQGEIEGLTTGLWTLDDALCGMRPGQLIILAARPGQGKTSLAMNVAQHVTLTRRERVLFVSLEMTREEITERWIASAASVDSKRVKNPRCLEIDERIAISNAVDAMTRCPILIDDTPGQTLSRIASNARRHKSRGGLSLLIVDYLGYVNGEGERGESNYQVVSRVSKGLKALAKELRLPLLVLHQLNRKSEDRADQRPRMADLRDSGQIEADADVVMLLHALAVEGQPTGAVECIIPKNRNGPPGVVNLSFHGPCTRFDVLAGGTNGAAY